MGLILGGLFFTIGILIIKVMPYLERRDRSSLYQRVIGINFSSQNESILKTHKTGSWWFSYLVGVVFLILGLLILFGYFFAPILVSICIISVILRLRAQKRK